MRKLNLSDIVCVSSAIIIILMTVLSATGTTRTAYKLWTGILCSLFCLIPLYFRHAKVMNLPLVLVVMIDLTIIIHAYGVLLIFYDDIRWYDTITHLAASITVSLLIFLSLVAVEEFDHQTRFGPRGAPLVVALIMTTFSLWWEVLEFVVDMTTGINMQYSPWDTMRDLVCNEVGTIIVAVALHFYLKTHSIKGFMENLDLSPSLKRMVSRKPKKENLQADP
jgi:hypothetical protein